MSKNNTMKEKKRVESKHKAGVFMCLGMCFGMFAGAVFDHASNGFMMGMLLGLVIDAVIQELQKKGNY